ncbi:MAG: hypothetical protein ACRDZ0_07810 [Acidimicrobiales bacterium]
MDKDGALSGLARVPDEVSEAEQTEELRRLIQWFWHDPSLRGRPTDWPAGVAVAVAMVAVAMVAVAVMAAVAGVVLTGADDELVPTAAGGVPILVPKAVPDGLVAVGALDLPQATRRWGPSGSRLRCSGTRLPPTPSRRPTWGSRCSVPRVSSPLAGTTSSRSGAGWESIDAAGRRAVMWQEAPGVLGAVTSATLARADLVAAADGRTFGDDYARVDVPVLPPGLALVGTLNDAAFTGALVPAILPITATGHILGYHDADRDRVLVVATFTAEPGESLVVWWMLGASRPGRAAGRHRPAPLPAQRDRRRRTATRRRGGGDARRVRGGRRRHRPRSAAGYGPQPALRHRPGMGPPTSPRRRGEPRLRRRVQCRPATAPAGTR